MEQENKAVERLIKLTAAIRTALRSGVRHYDLQGNFLSTEEKRSWHA